MGRCPRCGRQASGYSFCPDDGAAIVAHEPPPAELAQIDRYRLVRKIGEGASSDVFEAEHVHIGKRVAIKVLRRELARDPRVIERLRREARATTAIGHRNIVEVQDFGVTADGSVYLVMEWLRGETLAARIDRGPLALAAVIDCVTQICAGLAAAHEAGVIHRDLKPANVYLVPQPDGTDVVKLLDFGVAKLLASEARLTQHGMVVGTPDYMAPEQAQSEEVDARADLYAIGVLLYRLVTGTLPFSGDSLLAILHQHAVKPPEPPSQRAPDREIPAALEAVILRCLEKRAEDRFASADEVRRALEAAREPAPAPPPPAWPEQSMALPGRSRAPLAVALLLVAAGVAGAAFWLVRGRRPEGRAVVADAGLVVSERGRPQAPPVDASPASALDASPAEAMDASPATEPERWTVPTSSGALDLTASVVPRHLRPGQPFRLDIEVRPRPELAHAWLAGGTQAQLTLTHYKQHVVAHQARHTIPGHRLTTTIVLPSAGKHHVRLSLLAGDRHLASGTFDLCVGADPGGPPAELERVCPRMNQTPDDGGHHHH